MMRKSQHFKDCIISISVYPKLKASMLGEFQWMKYNTFFIHLI